MTTFRSCRFLDSTFCYDVNQWNIWINWFVIWRTGVPNMFSKLKPIINDNGKYMLSNLEHAAWGFLNEVWLWVLHLKLSKIFQNIRFIENISNVKYHLSLMINTTKLKVLASPYSIESASSYSISWFALVQLTKLQFSEHTWY